MSTTGVEDCQFMHFGSVIEGRLSFSDHAHQVYEANKIFGTPETKLRARHSWSPTSNMKVYLNGWSSKWQKQKKVSQCSLDKLYSMIKTNTLMPDNGFLIISTLTWNNKDHHCSVIKNLRIQKFPQRMDAITSQTFSKTWNSQQCQNYTSIIIHPRSLDESNR